MTKDSMGNEAKRYCSFCEKELPVGYLHACSRPEYTQLLSSIDYDKEVPANERTGSGAYSIAMLCKQDKEQLDRIEDMLKQLLSAPLVKI